MALVERDELSLESRVDRWLPSSGQHCLRATRQRSSFGMRYTARCSRGCWVCRGPFCALLASHTLDRQSGPHGVICLRSSVVEELCCRWQRGALDERFATFNGHAGSICRAF
jgi:hypothetical protein